VGTIGRAVADGMTQPRGEGLGVGLPHRHEPASPWLRSRLVVVVHLGTRQRRACGTFAPAESPPAAPLLSPLVTLPAPVLGSHRPQEFRPHASHRPPLRAEDGSAVAVTSTTVSRRTPPGVWTCTCSPWGRWWWLVSDPVCRSFPAPADGRRGWRVEIRWACHAAVGGDVAGMVSVRSRSDARPSTSAVLRVWCLAATSVAVTRAPAGCPHLATARASSGSPAARIHSGSHIECTTSTAVGLRSAEAYHLAGFQARRVRLLTWGGMRVARGK
jgi:hypothetical protein